MIAVIIVHPSPPCAHTRAHTHTHTMYVHEHSLSEGSGGQSTGGGHSFEFLDLSADVLYLVMQMRGRDSLTTDAAPRGDGTFVGYHSHLRIPASLQ